VDAKKNAPFDALKGPAWAQNREYCGRRKTPAGRLYDDLRAEHTRHTVTISINLLEKHKKKPAIVVINLLCLYPVCVKWGIIINAHDFFRLLDRL
jgi:hypothetical protein